MYIMDSIQSCEHLVEIALLVTIILVLYGCGSRREGLVAGDPFGISLAYDTFNSSTTSGPGTNAYLESASFPRGSYADATGLLLR